MNVLSFLFSLNHHFNSTIEHVCFFSKGESKKAKKLLSGLTLMFGVGSKNNLCIKILLYLVRSAVKTHKNLSHIPPINLFSGLHEIRETPINMSSNLPERI